MADDELVIYQGAAFDVVFDVTDDEGVAVPLDGFKAAMQVRSRTDVDPPLLDLSSDDGTLVIEPGGATGEVHVRVGGDVTAPLTRGGVYDCIAWDPLDPTGALVIADGRVRVKRRVTRKP
jgi:hypothetical protein